MGPPCRRILEVPLTPQSLGLPASFAQFRADQVVVLERIQASSQRWIIVQAPTGAGKTLIGAATARLLGVRALYTCHTRQLQDQFVRDFPYAVDLKGRANYPTHLYAQHFPRINCSMCQNGEGANHCHYCCEGGDELDPVCRGRAHCPYLMQKQSALAAELAVVNVSYLLHEANLSGAFSRAPLIIWDEGDLLESQLISFLQITISRRLCARSGVSPPEASVGEAKWVQWASTDLKAGLDRLAYALQTERVLSTVDRGVLSETVGLLAKLKAVAAEGDCSNWVMEEDDQGWTLRPVRVSRLADQYLWRHGDRHLIISATIISIDQFAEDLGIPVDQLSFVDMPCRFPKERRPVIVAGGVDMSYRNRNRGAWAQLVSELDAVLAHTGTVKTLVHTVSHDLTRYILNESQHKERMLPYLDTGGTRTEIVAKFKKSDPGTVLVAAGLDRGVDLPHDLCRCTIVSKIPFPSLGDQQVARRLKTGGDAGQKWYATNTVRTFCQMIGRGMRSRDDWCVCVVLDGRFRRLYARYRRLFPEYVREALDFGPTVAIATRLQGPP